MKIIRPQYTPPKKVEILLEPPIKEGEKVEFQGNTYEVKSIKTSDNVLIDDTTTPVQYLMDSVIADKDRIINKEPVTMGNYVRFEITLTKKQYELWQKKGGEKWLKRTLVGQKLPKKR